MHFLFTCYFKFDVRAIVQQRPYESLPYENEIKSVKYSFASYTPQVLLKIDILTFLDVNGLTSKNS